MRYYCVPPKECDRLSVTLHRYAAACVLMHRMAQEKRQIGTKSLWKAHAGSVAMIRIQKRRADRIPYLIVGTALKGHSTLEKTTLLVMKKARR